MFVNQKDKLFIDILHRVSTEYRDFSWAVDTECKRAGIDPDSMTFHEELASDIESLIRGRSSVVVVTLDARRRRDGASIVGWVVAFAATKSAYGCPRGLCAVSTIDNSALYIENGWQQTDFTYASASATTHSKRWQASDRSDAVSQVEGLIRSLAKDYDVVAFSTRDGRGRLLSHADRLMPKLAHASPKARRRLASRRATIVRATTARLRDVGFAHAEAAMADIASRILPHFASRMHGVAIRRMVFPTSVCSLMRAASGDDFVELSHVADIIECIGIDTKTSPCVELTSSVTGDDVMLPLVRLVLSTRDTLMTSYVLSNMQTPLGEVLRYIFAGGSAIGDDYAKRMIDWADASYLTPADVLGARHDAS